VYYYTYLSIKVTKNLVITVEFKEFSTRQLLMMMFLLTVIKLLPIQNITLEF